jgi:hypothetical protein
LYIFFKDKLKNGSNLVEIKWKRGVYTRDYAAHMLPFLAMVFENGRNILDEITPFRDLIVLALFFFKDKGKLKYESNINVRKWNRDVYTGEVS